VRMPSRRISENRISIAAATGLVLAAILQTASGYSAFDVASYDAGYAAAARSASARALQVQPGVTTSVLCDRLVKQALVGGNGANVRRADFLNGCKHAVADSME
jgi:hypothetical protein